MKRIGSRALCAALVAVFAVCISSAFCLFANPASNENYRSPSRNAYNTNHIGPVGSLCYLYDYYPTLDEETFISNINMDPEGDIIYSKVTPSDIDAMYEDGYFSDLPSNSLVVIDIKNIGINANTLYYLFEYLRTNDVVSALITYADYGSNPPFYPDIYVRDYELTPFYNFLLNSIFHYTFNSYLQITPFKNSLILLDSVLFDSDSDFDLSNSGCFIPTYIRALDLYSSYYNYSGTITDYIQYLNVEYLVHQPYTDNEFKYLYNTSAVDTSTVLLPDVAQYKANNEIPEYNACAYSIDPFNDDFYDFLYYNNNILPDKEIPYVYYFTLKEYNDPNGLDVITPDMLKNLIPANIVELNIDDAAQESFISKLHSCFGY